MPYKENHELCIFAMAIDPENGGFTLAKSLYPSPNPVHWDVSLCLFHFDTGEIEIIEEHDELSTKEEAISVAEKIVSRYPHLELSIIEE